MSTKAASFKGRYLSITDAPLPGVVLAIMEWNVGQPIYRSLRVFSVGGLPQHLSAFVPELSWKEVLEICNQHGVDPE